MNSLLNKKPWLAPGELVKAYSIANFSGTQYEDDFRLNGAVSEWIGGGKSAKKMPAMANLTPLEEIIYHNALRVKFSEYAAEHYVTDDITGSIHPNAYTSSNLMIMNGSQYPHYHPADSEFPENSLRVALVLPAANTDESKKQGLTFSAFNINKAEVSQRIPDKDGQKVIPEIKGTPVTPEHIIDLEPGHVTLLVFRGNSIHSFEGEGVIYSMHPLDLDVNKLGNTYDGNTLRWMKDVHLEIQKAVSFTSKGADNPMYTSLPEFAYAVQAVFDAHLRNSLLSHDLSNPLTAAHGASVRSKLREISTPDYWDSRSAAGMQQSALVVG